jgi:Leucine-rich repeat (LRR) protein
MAIRIWDGSGWNGLVGFENVQNKCLVEVDSSNEIHMHDHLRHMGREIAESPGLPRRLWREIKFIDDLLQQFHGQVVTDVRGIKTLSDAHTGSDDDSSELPWYQRSSYEVFGSCAMKLRNRLHNTPYRGIGIRKLQLLATEGGMLEQILRRVQSPNLIWLRWYKCPYSSLPSWIPMKNLRVLEVRGNKLQHLWHAEHQSPWQLRQLDIVSPLSKLPKSIGRLRHLERIVLKESKLKTLPDEFSDLRSLRRFELTNCSMLKSLPDSFGDLLNLEYIDLSYSSDLQMLPNSFGHLIRLKYLNLSYCRSLTMSSRALKNISTLEYINFSYCYKIEELPLQVAKQMFLVQLYLIGTNLKELPSAFGELTKLQMLDITGCTEVEDLPCFETSVALEELRASYCVKLKSIQGLAQLTKLRTLDVSECSELEALPGVEHLRSLEYLGAKGCPQLQCLESLDQLRQRFKALEIGRAERAIKT